MKVQILLADDHEITRRRLSELIQMHDGWEVCAAVQDGLEAVAKAKQLSPDIIILDLAMPKMDGLSVAREIRKILPSTPIVLYTLHAIQALDMEAKKVGIRRIVPKPNTEVLLRVIEEVVGERPRQRAASVSFRGD